MWPFEKKIRQRRREIRKNIPPTGLSLWRRMHQAGGIGGLLLAAGLFIGAGLLDAWPVEPFGYRLGQYVPHNIVARVSFSIPIDGPVEFLPQTSPPTGPSTNRRWMGSASQPTTGPTPTATTQTSQPVGPGAPTPRPIVRRRSAKIYRAGEVLAPHNRSAGGDKRTAGLGPGELQLLRAEHDAYIKLLQPWRKWLRLIGRAVLLMIITAFLCIYVTHYNKRIITNHWRALAVVVVMLVMLALSKTMIFALKLNPHASILVVLMGAAIFTIVYDQRFALATAAALSMFVVLQLRSDLPLLVVLLVGTAALVFGLREVRTRTKLIEVAAVAGGCVLVTVTTLSLSRGMGWLFALVDGLWAGGFAMLAGFIVQGVLPLIERLFRIATSMTLLECCDASRPLLKRLRTEAPGTFNHSLQLGAMCEAAAEEIGAGGLLARSGAYYHDIGKINKPDYFVENESGASSRHAKLSPAMSLLIIVGHVKDGLEMAREYGLPAVLQEFIGTHHGTTLVQCFYQAAADQHRNDADRAPDEVEFRYPGPKPQCKESAILMLADASESSVRAMNEPTAGRIANQVHTMVIRRLMDGQLDECELTLKEVHLIEASIARSLCSIYHGRIAYPTPPGEKPSAAELPSEPQANAQGDQEQDQYKKPSGDSEDEDRAS